MIKNILFDLGGVLLDFDLGKMARGFSRVCDLSEDEVRKIIFGADKAAFECGKISNSEFYGTLTRKLNCNIDFQEFSEMWCDIFCAKNEMMDLFEKLTENYPIYLLSNTDPLHFQFILDRFPVLRKCRGFALSYELKVCKPDRRFYSKAMEKLQLKEEECFYVDDWPENVEAAKEFGIRAIHYNGVEGVAKELRKIGVEV